MDMDAAAEVAGKPLYGFSGVFCEQCGTLVNGRGRGPRRRFCSDPCRMAFWRAHLKEVRRLGERVFQSRRRAAAAVRPHPRPLPVDRAAARAAAEGLAPGSFPPGAVRIGRQPSAISRQRAFLAAAARVAPRLRALDPAAERARLEALSADQAELAIPRGEYEAMRLATLGRLGPVPANGRTVERSNALVP